MQVGSDIVFQSSPWYQGIGSVAVRDDGRFLIVWTAAVEDPCCAFEYDVHARLYDPLGSALTPEFQVNIFEEDAQSHSVAAAISNGNFVVAWGDRVQGGIFFSLYARMFDGDANALTGEILVDQLGMDLQLPSSIRATPAGGFVIAWESREDGNSYMRQFDADAEPLGDQVKVNGADPDLNVASGSLLSIRSDGTMLAAWAAGGYQQPIGRIMGRMYDASLQPLTEPFQINGFDLDGKGIGGVFLPDTGDIFHVAWEISSPHETDGSGAGVFRAIGCIGDGPDSDGDGTGDSCDPCTAGYTFDRADRSRFRFIGDLFGNDRYAFSGEFIIGSIAEWTAIDPEVLLRIRVEGDRRRALIDADLSGSNLWSVNGSSMKWTYRDTSAAIDGITKVKMQFVNGDDPRIRIKVAGKNAHYGIAADEAQQAVSVTYGNAVDGECAQVGFLASECRFDGLGRAFSCSQ